MASLWPYLLVAACLGLVLAWQATHLAVTAALLIGFSVLVLGPHIAAASMALKLYRAWYGRLRWPLCLAAGLSTAGLLDYFGDGVQLTTLWLGLLASIGTILGHDAGLAALALRARSAVDLTVFFLFPCALSGAVLLGYGAYRTGLALSAWLGSLF